MATQKAAGTVVAVSKKYTVQSTGIWESVRRVLAVDPNRSNGVPLNPQFRNPPPGSNPPLEYDDPVSIPAGDIAENPYWKRDVRRAYPKLSVLSQADVVGLLSVGSAASPKQELIGEAGAKALVDISKEGEEKGLAALFVKDSKAVSGVVGSDGTPFLPPALNHASTRTAKGDTEYRLEADQSYEQGKYPCRTFS